MKVLLATHFFPPNHHGGTEAYTLGLARMLQRRGHAPYVYCAEDWGAGDNQRPWHDDSIHAGIPVRRLHWNWQLAPDPFVNFYDNPETEQQFAAYLRELRPDVVHITSCYALGAGIIRAARQEGVPTFLTLTDFWFLCPRHTLQRGDGSLCPGPESAATCSVCMATNSTLFRRLNTVLPAALAGRALLEVSHHPKVSRLRGFRGYVGDAGTRLAFLRRVFDDLDTVIAPSRFLIETFAANGFPAERIRFSPYGMDLTWQSQLRSRQPGSPLRVGYIGQVEPIKGVDVLVDAFQAVTPALPAELRIYGDIAKNPAFGNSVRHRARDNANIKFMGPFERSRLADVLSELDVLVVPSMWYENTPLVIYEAFAAQKPVIATNLGGMSELVKHDVNGLLFERGNVAELANALRRFVHDTELRERLRRAIPPVRTIDEEVEDLLGWYQTAASRRPGDPALIGS